ncbi:MAG: non-canonical purine NTP pyrophosphatase, partial [Minisyncoccales bacterium]
MINYITENKNKFSVVKSFFEKNGIEINQKILPIYEIQSNEGVEIAVSKARQAWETIKEPLFVNDAFWIMPALKGFPGPYMKYMNEWLEPEDFLKLVDGKSDRTIILRDTIVYIDESGEKVFTNDYYGEILDKKYDGDYKYPIDAIVSFSKNKKTIAEEKGVNKFSTEGSWTKF